MNELAQQRINHAHTIGNAAAYLRGVVALTERDLESVTGAEVIERLAPRLQDLERVADRLLHVRYELSSAPPCEHP